MRPGLELSRRDLFALTGSGLFVFFRVEPLQAFQEPAKLPTWQGPPSDFNAYLRIGEDGRVTAMAGKVELGQGVTTSLAQMLAEELDVTLDSVDMLLGDTDLCPWDMGTFGSLSTRMLGPVIRAAGAEARAVLVQMAAERLQVPAERLEVKAGVVSDTSAPRKRVSYAELVQGRRIERHLEKTPLKPVAAFRVIGQSPRRKDAIEKVTGRAKYAGDMSIPGTLHARILRPPAHGATLKEADTSAAEKVAGVRVVKDGDLIAVLHERPDVAEQALGLIQARFDRPQPSFDDRSVFDHVLKTASPFHVVHASGSLAEGEKLAASVLDLTYLNSYVAHAPMETHAAVARIEGGKVTVWASTQTPFPLKQQLAQALGLAPENVRVIARYVGGGFGGKSASRQAIEAARLAKIAGRPVQVVMSRAEEFFYDAFRPAAVVKIRSGLTAAGAIAFWDY
ncbi:MAG: molybdopterin cofactor-binding domain-containing protein [Bryobacteraceae bacterium]